MATNESKYIFFVEDGIIYRQETVKGAEKEELTHQRQLSKQAMLKYFAFKNADKKPKEIIALYLDMVNKVKEQQEYKPKRVKEYVLVDGKRVPKFNADGTQQFDKKGKPKFEYVMVESVELRKTKSATGFKIGDYFWTNVYGKDLVPAGKRKAINKAKTEEELLLELLK